MEYEEFLAEWNNDSPFVEVKTSGSTGSPKQMLVEKERMLASARMTCDFLGLKEGDSALLCMSLDYIAGKMMVVRSIERELKLTVVGPSLTPRPLPQGEGAENSLHFDLVAMVPAQVYASIDELWLRRSKNIIIGGGAISAELQSMIEKGGFEGCVWSSYGMTETLSHIALRRLNGPEASDWYTPFEGVEVSLNEEGCLVINAPHICPEPLITNDIAELLPLRGQGGFRIKGRKDNVICSGGIKIQIEEVEQLLNPYLKEPFVITKRKDEKFGEVVVLLTESLDLETIKQECQQRLPRYWQPKHFVHVVKIPMTETGKPARQVALSLAEEI